MAPAVYVPAWKRLGLKLKSTNGNIDSSQSSTTDVVLDGKKRKSPTAEDDSGEQTRTYSHATKRQRKDDTASSPSRRPINATKNSHQEPNPSSIPSKRKSVSFASDSKGEDGDSTKDLYKNWLTQQDPNFEVSTANEALREVLQGKPMTGNAEAQDQKSKKLNNTKPRKKVKPPKPSSHKADKALRYLNGYDASSSDWKFNKSRQTFILQQAFDVFKIPPSYDRILRSYLTGLSGKTARSRLRGQARRICMEDDEALGREDAAPREANEEATEEVSTEGSKSSYQNSQGFNPQPLQDRKAEYQAALQQYKASLSTDTIPPPNHDTVPPNDAFTLRLCRRKRAELLLWSLKLTPAEEDQDSEHQVDEPQVSTLTLRDSKDVVEPSQDEEMQGVSDSKKPEEKEVVKEVNGKAGKRKRKRKKRLAAVEESSSSSSSSSSGSEGE